MFGVCGVRRICRLSGVSGDGLSYIMFGGYNSSCSSGSSSRGFSSGTMNTNTIKVNVDPIMDIIENETEWKIGKSESADMLKKLIKCRPLTPGQRHRVRIDRSELWYGSPVKSLVYGKKRINGRNHHGRITVRGRGGGNKRRGRIVDFDRAIMDEDAEVVRLEYAPDRSAYLALLKYKHDGTLTYIHAPEGIGEGDVVRSSRTQALPLNPGNAMPLEMVPAGTVVHNVELIPFTGAKYARAAGTFCVVMAKNVQPQKCLLRMNSGEQRIVDQRCMVTVGRVGNRVHYLQKLGKAGANRWRGRRPKVRGVAMNPCDHPHGGGEGRSKGRISCTPWGVPTKGYKTRRHGKRSSKVIHMTRKEAQTNDR